MLLSPFLLPIPSQHSLSHGSQRQLASFRAFVVGPTPGASWPGGRREGWKSVGLAYHPTPLHGPEASSGKFRLPEANRLVPWRGGHLVTCTLPLLEPPPNSTQSSHLTRADISALSPLSVGSLLGAPEGTNRSVWR